jgi:ABC-2 type transport system permease protein
LFPVENLPKILDVVTKVNPLTYGIDGMRYAFTGVSYFPPLLSFGVLIGFSAITVLIGLYQFSKIEL